MIFNENGEILNESLFKSKLKEDFEKKPDRYLSEFTKVLLTEYIKREHGTFKKFLNTITLGIAFLCTSRIKNAAIGAEGLYESYSPDKINGCAFYNGKNIVSVIFVLTTDNGEKIIDYIEISKNYRGMGLSKQLLDMAVNEYGGTSLSVDLDNPVAINVYKKYGFVPFAMWNNAMSMRLPATIQKINIHECEEKRINFDEADKITEANFASWYLDYRAHHYLYKKGSKDLCILEIYKDKFTIIPLSYNMDLSYITDISKRAIELGARYTVIPIKDTISTEFYEKAGLHREYVDKFNCKYTL